MTDPYSQPPQDPYAPQPPTPPTNPYATPPTNPYATPPTAPVPPVSSTPASTSPYGAYPQQHYQQPTSGYGYATTPPQNSMAIVSLIMSLVGIMTMGITAIVGAILGHVAMGQIKQSGESGEGMAKAGIIIGWSVVGLWVLGCCGVFALPAILAGMSAGG